MTAVVLRHRTSHAFNRLAAAEQEYRLACIAYDVECRRFDSLDRGRMAAFSAARERRNRVWDAYWAAQRAG